MAIGTHLKMKTNSILVKMISENMLYSFIQLTEGTTENYFAK